MKLIETGSFPIAEIVVRDRLRRVDPDHVAVIAATIETRGLQHPIQLRKEGNRHILVSGAHRVEAYRKLGRSDIPAMVLELEDGDGPEAAREMEIIENVARHDLSALDRAIHLGELLALHEAKNGPTKKGGDRKSQKFLTENQRKTFRIDLLHQLRVSRRSLEQYLALYKALDPKVRERLKGTALADNFTELRALASEEPKHQMPILALCLSGKDDAPPNISAAAALHHNNVDVTTPDERDFAAFKKLWARASKKLRRQITAHIDQQREKA